MFRPGCLLLLGSEAIAFDARIPPTRVESYISSISFGLSYGLVTLHRRRVINFLKLQELIYIRIACSHEHPSSGSDDGNHLNNSEVYYTVLLLLMITYHSLSELTP